MAVPANTYQTYQAIGIREDLANIIENISPIDFPFMSSIGRTKAEQTLHEWQTDSLAAASDTNAQIEGDDIALTAAVPTQRLGNRTQISAYAIGTATTNDWVNKAGRPGSELAYQLEKKGWELKRDMEAILSRNKPITAGAAGTARTLASLETWITTNDSRGAGGADVAKTAGQPNNTATPTDGTQRPLTEVLVSTVLQACFTQGGNPSVILVGPFNKGVFSTFTGNSTRMQSPTDNNTLAVSFDFYRSNWGLLKVVPSRFNRDRSLVAYEPEKWKLAIGEDFRMKPLADTGLSSKRLLWVEYTLEARQEAASGIVADLTTS